MKLINLTPHDINFVREDGTPLVTIPASGIIARVSVRTENIGDFAGIPVTSSAYGNVEGLPAPEDGTGYIVSSLVAQRCAGRTDVFIPNESVRDSQGRIIGCKSLGRIPAPEISADQAARQLGFASADAAWVAMMYS